MKHQIRTAAALAAASLVLSTSLLAQVVTRPNHVKYRDSSIPSATGRSGSATLEARALLGRDGNTDIDLASNGTIAKVQLKAGQAADNDHDTNHITVDGLVQHQPVGIEALVRDVDGARTDIVSVDEVVKLRPDLTVTTLSAPAQVSLDTTAVIYATVRELNGDVGARANALLLVNGAVADRADGIWVDAGDAVSVAFRSTFSTYGQANLSVVVEAVDPGDWDDANNSASATIDVAERFDNWNVHAAERTSVVQSTSHSPLWDTHTQQAGTDQNTDLYAWIQHPVNLNGMQLATSASTDGRTLYDVPDAEFRDPLHRVPNGAYCTSAETWNPRIDVCYQPMAHSQAPNGFVIFEMHWHATDVIYHSWGYDYSVDPYDPYGEPRGVYDTTTVRTEITTPMGNTVQWDIRFVDGDGVAYHEQPFLSSLTTSEYHRNDPPRCYDSHSWGFTVCTSYQEDRLTRDGRAVK